MKKLFCTVVTDPNGCIDLESPLIFHIKGNNSTQVEDAVHEILGNEYEYELDWIKELDIFTFEVTDLDIIELDTLECAHIKTYVAVRHHSGVKLVKCSDCGQAI